MNNIFTTPMGRRIIALVLQGDVHLARIEAEGQKFTRADVYGIKLACRKWKCEPVV